VLYRLKNAGYSAYLVGGGIRDLLLGREPKDFDVATNARPEQIRRCFRNGRIIGRRFRLVHILFKDEIIEVSTFRGEHGENTFEDDTHSEEGMLLNDNVYGSFVEDAKRRDFTINALYYNIADFSLIDCHHGLEDLRHGILRVIGDPEQRYREDPVRILRAVRLSAKLGFRIHEDSEHPIFTMGYLLSNVAPARLFTEIDKLFLSGMALPSFKLLRHYGLMKYLFPATESYLHHEDYDIANHFLTNAMVETDERVNGDKSVTPSFLLAVMLWYPLQKRIADLKKQNVNPFEATHVASSEIISEELISVAIPRRFTLVTREIWLLQESFAQQRRHRVLPTLAHTRYRAAFDFLVLRAKTETNLQPLVTWWQNFADASDDGRKEMMQSLSKSAYKRRRKKKPRRKS
jgi:poly(A) polymerase